MKTTVDVADAAEAVDPAKIEKVTISMAEYVVAQDRIKELETKNLELEKQVAAQERRYTKLFNCYAQLFNQHLDEELTREG